MDATKTAPTPKPGMDSNYRWVILFVTIILQMGTAIPGQSVPIFGAIMQAELGLTRAELGLLQTALALGQLVVIGFSGVVTDRVGIRPMLLAGMSVIGVFVAAAGIGGSYVLALAAFLAAGAGMAVVNPSIVKAIMYWFPPRIRATAMGIKQTGVPIGGVIAAVIMPAIAIAFGWRPLVVGLGLSIVALGVVSFLVCREYPDSGAGRVSTGSSTMGDLLRLLMRREVLLVSFVGAPMLAVQFALVTYFILYLNEDFGYSLIVGGVLLSLIQFGAATGRIFWGFASDNWFRANRRATLLTIVCLAALAMLTLAALPDGGSSWIVGALAIVAGATAVGWNGIWITQATELAGRELAGSVSGIAMMVGQLGIMLGPPIFGTVVDNTHSYRLGWLLMAAFCGISALLLLSLRSSRKVDRTAVS